MPRPKNFDKLDDETKAYITELEGDDVEKSTITKRADLPEDVQKSLKEADEIVERDKVRHWEEVAKGYKHFAGDKTKLAKTLRALSESNSEAYEELKTTLDAAEENLAQSDIFKSFGSPFDGGDETSQENAKAEELVAKSNGALTLEQAQVQLMDGRNYKPTLA